MHSTNWIAQGIRIANIAIPWFCYYAVLLLHVYNIYIIVKIVRFLGIKAELCPSQFAILKKMKNEFIFTGFISSISETNTLYAEVTNSL